MLLLLKNGLTYKKLSPTFINNIDSGNWVEKLLFILKLIKESFSSENWNSQGPYFGSTLFSITTFSITTFSITTFSITTFSITTLTITTFTITTLSTKGLLVTLSINDNQHKDTQLNKRAIMLSVAIYLLFCWMS